MIQFRSRTLTIALAGCCAWAGARAAGMPPEQPAAGAQAEGQVAAPAPATTPAHAAVGHEQATNSPSPAQGKPGSGGVMH